LKVQQLAAHQEAEISSVKHQMHVNKAEITNAVVAVREDVNTMQERLSKVEETSHELVHLNSSVQQIQQKLDDNASEASRQLREQGRQLEQEITKLKQRVGQPVPLPPHRIDSATDKGATIASMSRPEFGTGQEPRDGGLVSPAFAGKLGSTEFALPTFDENKGMNPQLYIGQLEEFLQFRGIQKQHWLTVAKKSIVGSVSKQ
jgi:hypothetical protein